MCGYLLEVLVNFLLLFGWNLGDDCEKMLIVEIICLFDLLGVNQSNVCFDDKKFVYMNMLYLLELLMEMFVVKVWDYFVKYNVFVVSGSVGVGVEVEVVYFCDVMFISQLKIKGFEELLVYMKYFFVDDDKVVVDLKVWEKVFVKGDLKVCFKELVMFLVKFEVDFVSDMVIEEVIKVEVVKNGLGFGDYQVVVWLVVLGMNVGLGLMSLFCVLGCEWMLKWIECFSMMLVF